MRRPDPSQAQWTKDLRSNIHNPSTSLPISFRGRTFGKGGRTSPQRSANRSPGRSGDGPVATEGGDFSVTHVAHLPAQFRSISPAQEENYMNAEANKAPYSPEKIKGKPPRDEYSIEALMAAPLVAAPSTSGSDGSSPRASEKRAGLIDRLSSTERVQSMGAYMPHARGELSPRQKEWKKEMNASSPGRSPTQRSEVLPSPSSKQRRSMEGKETTGAGTRAASPLKENLALMTKVWEHPTNDAAAPSYELKQHSPLEPPGVGSNNGHFVIGNAPSDPSSYYPPPPPAPPQLAASTNINQEPDFSSYPQTPSTGGGVAYREAERAEGLPSKVSNDLAHRHYTLQQMDRLKQELEEKNKELGALRIEHRKTQQELEATKKQNTQLIYKFENTHEHLKSAVSTIETQQQEIEKLKSALTGEVYDNDALKQGFMTLIRKAQKELKMLREQMEFQERSRKYGGGGGTL